MQTIQEIVIKILSNNFKEKKMLPGIQNVNTDFWINNLRNTVVQKNRKRNCQFLTLSLFQSLYCKDCLKKEKN